MAEMATTIALDPVDWTAWADDPYPLYRALRDEAPVYFDTVNDTYVLTRYDDVYGVLGDPARFSSVPLGLLDGTLAATSNIRMEDGARHKLLRNVVLPMFTSGALRKINPYFEDIVTSLVDAIDDTKIVDVTDAFAVPLPGRITLDIIGLPLSAHERFKELTDSRMRIILNRGGHSEPPEIGELLARVRAEMWEIVEPIAEARRRDPQHDVITLVVQAQAQHGRDEIPDEVAVNLLGEVLTAGFETTQHLIELLFDRFVDDPELWRRLREDRELIGPTLEEMLRFKSPTQALGRRPVGDVTFHGTEIPKDSWITIVYASANRDERQFEDPDTFLIERDLRRHVAFSYGAHYCAGAPLSRVEVKTLLNTLLDRYQMVERAGESIMWPNMVPGRVGRMPGFSQVPVRFVR